MTFLTTALGLWFGSMGLAAEGQRQQHRVVFEVNFEGQEAWQSILANVENLQKALGRQQTAIEVVAHGKGLGLLIKQDNPLQDRLKALADSGVVLAACQNTMRRMNISKDDLLPFAITVDSGVAEVVRKQEAGWAYVKGGA